MTKPLLDYESLMKRHPSLGKGLVWCRHCQRIQSVSSTDCLQHGWPKCCGFTMAIDSPSEQAALAKGKP